MIKLFTTIFLFCIAASLTSREEWLSFKNETILNMKHVPGWCSTEKAHIMMDVIKENKCQFCVELGVFSGMSLFPIAKALQYNRSGKVYAIDAWDRSEALKSFSSPNDPNYIWWGSLDYDDFFKQTLDLIQRNKLRRFCKIIKRSTIDAACLFADESIDFIHLDGNHNAEVAFQDLIHYFPKVKDGGYILLNDANWISMNSSVVFLLENTNIISHFSPSATFLLFRKSNQRLKSSSVLFNK